MKQIILASSSPRRKQLLKQIGLTFTVVPSSYEEHNEAGYPPHELVKKHAEEKARDVAKQYKNALVIGADTIVVIDELILGKPKSNTEAQEMLKKLSGKTHQVITGYSIIDTTTNQATTKSETTDVTFKKLSEDEILWYVSAEKLEDKAGAYAIQEKGALFVEKIEGDFNNAVGLPLFRLAYDLRKLKVEF